MQYKIIPYQFTEMTDSRPKAQNRTYDSIPGVVSFDKGMDKPFLSTAGVILNECNVEERIAYRVLSA